MREVCLADERGDFYGKNHHCTFGGSLTWATVLPRCSALHLARPRCNAVFPSRFGQGARSGKIIFLNKRRELGSIVMWNIHHFDAFSTRTRPSMSKFLCFEGRKQRNLVLFWVRYPREKRFAAKRSWCCGGDQSAMKNTNTSRQLTRENLVNHCRWPIYRPAPLRYLASLIHFPESRKYSRKFWSLSERNFSVPSRVDGSTLYLRWCREKSQPKNRYF